MKKKKVIIISVSAVLVVAVALFFLLRNSKKETYRLDTTTMGVNDISIMVTATGTIEPITKVDVGTQVSGIIDKIYVDYNSEVHKGQILAELDKTTLQSDLVSKEMELNAAKVEYEYQQANFNRINDLYNQQFLSQTDYETAKYTFDKAESTYKKLTSDLIKVKTNLGYATITSPIDGVVLSRAVEEGQTVAASFNTPTLFTIANDLTKMQVVANVDEADIGGVENDQRVTFTVDAFPEDIFNGTVTQVRLEATVTSNVVTYEVIINAPNPELKLKPGLTANITIYTMEEKEVNTLPNKALSYQPNPELLEQNGYTIQQDNMVTGGETNNGKRVWVLNSHILSPRNVTVGVTDGVNTEIKSGLNNNDVVVMGITVAPKKNDNGNGETSPFMPQRPGGGRR